MIIISKAAFITCILVSIAVGYILTYVIDGLEKLSIKKLDIKGKTYFINAEYNWSLKDNIPMPSVFRTFYNIIPDNNRPHVFTSDKSLIRVWELESKSQFITISHMKAKLGDGRREQIIFKVTNK